MFILMLYMDSKAGGNENFKAEGNIAALYLFQKNRIKSKKNTDINY